MLWTAVAVVCVSWLLCWLWKELSWLWLEVLGMKWRGRRLPPGPRWYPFVGTLYLLWRQRRPWEVFWRLGKEYGGIFTFWLGGKPHICITEWAKLKEAFCGRTAATLAWRPHLPAFDVIMGDTKGILRAVGEPWRAQRRFALRCLHEAGMGKGGMDAKIMHQVNRMLKRLRPGVQDLSNPIDNLVTNVMGAVLVGRSFEMDDPGPVSFKASIDGGLKALAAPKGFILRSCHRLSEIPYFRRHFTNFAEMQQHERTGRAFVTAQIEAARREWLEAPTSKSCFAFAYFEEQKRRLAEGDDSFDEGELFASLRDLWIGGLDTTVTTLKWAFLAMLHYPEVQTKVRKEIQANVGSRRLHLGDQKLLPYTHAAINEAQRWANIAKTFVVHAAEEDIELWGYEIPAEASVMIEFSAVLADPEIFPEPEIYRPERFLGQPLPEQLVPFSLGKRSCPGEALGRAELFLIFASVIQNWYLSPADPDGPLPSLEPIAGMVATPHPYKLRLEPVIHRSDSEMSRLSSVSQEASRDSTDSDPMPPPPADSKL